MPNWCSNTVLIKGDPQEIQAISKLLEEDGNPFSFNKVDKCPDHLRNASAPNRNGQSAAYNISKYGAPDWYVWCNTHWGTKWNSSDTTFSVDENVVRYDFQTAWSPPIPVYEKLAKMFPNTNIYVNFDESGVGFSGWKFYSQGELSTEQNYDTGYYSIKLFMEADDEIWDYLE